MFGRSLCVTKLRCVSASLTQAAPTGPLAPWLRELLGKNPHTREVRIGNASAIVRIFHLSDPTSMRYGLTIVFVTIPSNSYSFRVEDVRKLSEPNSIFDQLSKKEDNFVLVNGGYFGTNDGSHFYPLGLVIAHGKRLSKTWNWNTGGVLFASSDSSARIVPIRDFSDYAVTDAIQSKPLLVEHSRSGIRSDTGEIANRTAIAIGNNGSLIIAGAFNDDNYALTLYEFAQVLTSRQWGTEDIDYALNLDGGPGAHICVPSLNLQFGNEGVNYIPNALRFTVRHES